MRRNIDYFFSHASPWTYLGSERLHAIATAADASISYRPVSFAKIFAVSGGLPVGARAPQRQNYRLVELGRWRDYLKVDLILEPKYFPVPDRAANQLVIAADRQKLNTGRLSNAILRAVWAQERNIADDATLAAIATEQGTDGAALLDASKQPEFARTFDAYTSEAIERGVFGAPSYIVDGTIFWGQDRLDFLARALSAA
jgi:2-hydroxychromene-2-carboxylate isomerase